jgi:predicted DNA-binding WGR domain protein
LAIKQSKTDDEYALGIIIDDENHYNNPNWLEQYFQRPAILQAFGWRVIAVFAKDWLQQPNKVTERIIARLTQPIVEEKDSIEEPATIANNNFEMFIEENQTPIKVNDFNHLQFTRLVFTDSVSNKFWQVVVDDCKLIVQFGRVNTKGQTQIKSFATKELAEKEMNKLIVEKESKGYKKR